MTVNIFIYFTSHSAGKSCNDKLHAKGQNFCIQFAMQIALKGQTKPEDWENKPPKNKPLGKL